MKHVPALGILVIGLLALALPYRVAGQTDPFVVQPGDNWAALAMRFDTDEASLRALNPHMNRTRQPAIGRLLAIPEGASERTGRLLRVGDGGLLQTAARQRISPWALATLNGRESPYAPTFFAPLHLPGEGTIRDLPPGIRTMELSAIPALPGQALGLRGTTEANATDIVGRLDGLDIAFATAANRFAGVVGTGAFYAGGEPELVIRTGDAPAWSQPLAFDKQEWVYQELTLTGQAAEIDQQARDEERARLRTLWTAVTPTPLWKEAFQTPINDYLEVSAGYGARRSYNGGPYLTYHEGVDFSAYAGTPVMAPAAGVVVLAEPLYVRGGAVILDHGLGVFSGYYHLSAVHVAVGQSVEPGDLLGEVGTTGLSTGNHLHWDLLINGIWVDAAQWQAQGLDCWLLEGIGEACVPPPTTG